MILRFVEIKNEVYAALSLRPADATNQLDDMVELRINQAQDYIFYKKNWAWRKRTAYLTTRDIYETGTVATTQGSRTVTGTSTVWTDLMRVGEISMNGRIYKIDRRASNTSIILTAAFPDADLSGATYQIGFRYYAIPSFLSAITDVLHEGTSLLWTTKSNKRIDLTIGRPDEFWVGDRLEEDFYTTGTVDVTNGSASVTGTSTAFDSIMDGMHFKVNSNGDLYTIRERTSATALTLDRPYQGTTATGQAYTINPAGTPLIAFNPIPDDFYHYSLEGLIKPVKLVDDNDVSLLPDHTALLMGSIWLAKYYSEDQNPVKIQQAESDFLRQMELLDHHYEAIKAPRWISNEEISARYVGRTPTFRPLDKRRWR